MVKVNGVVVCTATISNGQGSCVGKVTAVGALTFTADFAGTVSGVSGTATAQTTVSASAASVAIDRASIKVGRCTATLRLLGLDTAAGRKITI